MLPDQAMFNEANISRTLVADALAGRCAQLAGEKAQLENQLAEYAAKFEAMKKEVEDLKAAQDK
ncbi:MAG: hypothetical protein NUV75_02000 [Gallionella sp.]|nr:hypothetical protein [Gallionella sp.]